MPPNTIQLLKFCLVLALSYVFVDIVIFRFLYPSILAFNSGGGFALFRVQSQAKWDENPDMRHTAIVGNSRISEAFSTLGANTVGKQSNVDFTDLSVPSTTLRVWYYLLKSSDPLASKFDYILIPIPNFSALPAADSFSEQTGDLDYLSPIARIQDTSEIVSSFHSFENKFTALRALLLKSFAYRYDVRDLIMRMRSRLALDEEAKGSQWTHLNNYSGNDKDLVGLQIDLNKKSFTLPASADPLNNKLLNSALTNLSLPTTPENIDYYRHWLTKLAQHYASPHQKIILFQIPLHPFLAPEYSGPRLPFLNNLSKEKFITLPDDLLFDLADPKYFFDGMHMNRKGRHIVTERLANAVAHISKEAGK